MKILLVYAHPSSPSFNAALKDCTIQTLANTQDELQISDLYAQHFKAVGDWQDFDTQDHLSYQYGPAQKIAYDKGLLTPDIQKEQEKILWSKVILLQFPLWWFGMPAILKGWFDRVFTPGFAYDKNKWFRTSPLYGRRVRLVLTTQAPESSYQTNGLNGDIYEILKPIHHSLHFLGLTPLVPFTAYGVMGGDSDLLKKYLENYTLELQNLENLATIPIPHI